MISRPILLILGLLLAAVGILGLSGILKSLMQPTGYAIAEIAVGIVAAAIAIADKEEMMPPK